MKTFLIVATIIYGLALCVLLFCAVKRHPKYLQVKTGVSILFVLISIISFLLGHHELYLYFSYLFVGILFCFLGDRFLGYADHNIDASIDYLKKGIYSFGIAHLFFILFLQKYQAISYLDFIIPIFLMILLFIFKKLKLVNLRNIDTLIYIYTFIVGFMTSKAISVTLFASVGMTHHYILTIGSILFVLSDTVLLFLYFYKKKVEFLRPFNLLLYYSAVFLLAVSAYWL